MFICAMWVGIKRLVYEMAREGCINEGAYTHRMFICAMWVGIKRLVYEMARKGCIKERGGIQGDKEED